MAIFILVDTQLADSKIGLAFNISFLKWLITLTMITIPSLEYFFLEYNPYFNHLKY